MEYTTTVIAGVNLLEVKNADGDTSGTASPNQWLVDWVRGGPESDSGVAVNGETALQFAPLWNSVSKIAGHVGQLPLITYRQTDDREKEKARNHPTYRKLKRQPNASMGSTVFKETLQQHALLWGNGRAAIIRNQRNDVDELIPLDPSTWHTVLIDGEKWHYTNNDPVAPDGKRRIHDDDVLHIAGLGYDGICGYSVIQLAKNSLGLGLASEKASSRHFRNNAKPSMVLQAPAGVFRKEADAQDFLQNFNRYHKGVDNAEKVALLREGIEAKPLSMSASDSQWIEQRKFQRQEAALWMCVEQILGDDSSVSYNSLEQKNQAYLSGCLQKWLTKWEEECERKLLTDQQQRTESHFIKFRTAALLRGTTKERYEVYQIGRMIGVLSANDVRELEDMNPIEGGDNYDNPAITTTTEQPNEQTEQPTETNEQTEARLRNLIQSQLSSGMAYEVKRIREAADSNKPFCPWVDTFYDKFASKLADMFDDLGGDSMCVINHIAESKQRLFDVAGSSTKDELKANIDAELATWPARIIETTDKLMERKQ